MASPSFLDLIIAWIVKHQTILVAVYGAVVATAVAIWNIYRSITDRGRLRVTVTRANVFAPGVGDIARDKLWYQVTNAGRQPIWLRQIGGGYRNGQHFMIDVPQQLPKKLEPGETFDDASSDFAKIDYANVAFLGAWDSLGKIHELSKRRLKALRKEGGGA